MKTWRLRNSFAVERRYETTFRCSLSDLESRHVTFESFNVVEIVSPRPPALDSQSLSQTPDCAACPQRLKPIKIRVWLDRHDWKSCPSRSFEQGQNKAGRLRRPASSLKAAGRSARSTTLTYVPSDHPARYSSCSGVSRSILIPIDSSFSLATRLSSSSGTR